MTIKITLPVIPRTKKNNMVRTKTGIIQSAVYRQYEKDCLMLIPCEYRHLKLDKPCRITTVFFMPDNRRVDLSNLISACHDVLVKGGVIADDSRSIVQYCEAWAITDKKYPRTEISIEVVE